MATSWVTAWNDIVSYVLFADDELKRLMQIPAGTKLMTFIDEYFVRTGTASQPLTDQKVRIVYSTHGTGEAGSVHVLRQEMSFDIYVQQSQLHNVSDEDRLQYRTEIIAERLKKLLSERPQEETYGYRFRCIGMSEMATTTIGYARYNITFSYKRTV